MSRSTPLLRSLVILVAGCAVLFFLWRFLQLDESMLRALLPPPEVQ